MPSSQPTRSVRTSKRPIHCLTSQAFQRSAALAYIVFFFSQDISVRISQLLGVCTTSQRAYLAALSAYRASLKDVLERETALRTVVRDREILVGRLIKLGNKKPADSALASHEAKLEEAQIELSACESELAASANSLVCSRLILLLALLSAFLQDEVAAINGLKRWTFREALVERMKSMGELGRVMDDSAQEAVSLLSQLGRGNDYVNGKRSRDVSCGRNGIIADLLSATPAGYHHDPEDFGGSAAGDSITPSLSASQALSRTSSVSSGFDDDEDALPAEISVLPPAHQLYDTSAPVHSSSAPAPAPAPTPARHSRNPSRSPSHDRRPATAIAQTGYSASTITGTKAAPPAPRPVFPAVPTAPRLADSMQNPSGPTFEIPKAPANVGSRAPQDDSSDEEAEREFAARKSGAAAGPAPGTTPARLRRKAMSETSSFNESGDRRRRHSFFGGIAALFRRKERSSDDGVAGSGSPSAWETRTERNVSVAQRSGGTGGTVGGGTRRPRMASLDDSDSDDMPQNVVRVVNDPKKMRQKAMSDVGVPTSPMARAKLERRRKDDGDTVRGSMGNGHGRAASAANLVGSTGAGRGSTVSLGEGSVVKRKKKKAVGSASASVLAADDGMLAPPRANGPVSNGVSRSNTLASTRTAATTATAATGTTVGTGQRKKKKKVATPVPLAIPTAADLASSLPSAQRSSVYVPPALVEQGEHLKGLGTGTETGKGKVPKTVAETEKKGKKYDARYGNDNWIATPTGSGPGAGEVAGGAKHSHAHRDKPPRLVASGPEQFQQESLMAIVDRDAKEGRGELEPTSRRYGVAGDTTGSGEVTPRPQSMLSPGASLQKRKSVRLVDAPSDLGSSFSSPQTSVRSDSLAPPRHGILVNHTASPPSSLIGVERGWDTRVSNGKGVGGDDSSDEDDEDQGYKDARRAFAKGTKGLESWIGPVTLDKGKGKARQDY